MGDIIIIIGPPCVGKGTISQLLEEQIDYKHISIGQVLRDKYPIGTEIRTLIDSGKMANNNIIIDILKEFKNQNIILDGFPRTEEQVALLDGFKNNIKGVFIIDAEYDILLHRMKNRYMCDKCGKEKHNNCSGNIVKRVDDVEDIYNTRLNLYKNNIDKIIVKLGKFPIKHIDNNHIKISEIVDIIKNYIQ